MDETIARTERDRKMEKDRGEMEAKGKIASLFLDVFHLFKQPAFPHYEWSLNGWRERIVVIS